jgi:hypothetical protein
MTLRHKCAHFRIGQRPVLFAVARDVPLDISLLASHGDLVSMRGTDGNRARSPWPTLAFLHGANVVRDTLSRQLAAPARVSFVHRGNCCTPGPQL